MLDEIERYISTMRRLRKELSVELRSQSEPQRTAVRPAQ